MSDTADKSNKPRTWKKALAWCFFLGFFGAHRFYVGRWKTGIAQVLTFGGIGLWSAYDLFCIWTESFADGKGHTLARS